MADDPGDDDRRNGAPTDADMIRRARRTHGMVGGFIAAAGLGLSEVLEGRKKRDEGSVVVDAPGEPGNVDRDGLTVAVDDSLSVTVGALPPMRPIITPKSRRRGRRRGQ